MKLFQRLLVAPAALGLIAPVAVNADTAFNSTTTLSGQAVFTLGQVDDGGTADTSDELYMQYAYGLDINSSFTGEDNFYVGIEAGNASGPLSNMDSAVDGTEVGASLTVTSLFYSFPLGELTVTGGPLLDTDDVIAATASAYSDSFRLGALPYSVDNGITGPGLAVSYANDNGFVASASFVSSDGASSSIGIGGDEGDDTTTFTVGYDGDGFGGGLVLANNDGEGSTTADDGDSFGGGIYYSPESIPATISVAYDSVELDHLNDRTDFFVGVDYEAGPGTLSVAYNSTDVEDGSGADDDTTGFEVSYSYPVNDNVTITPGYFTVEDNTGEDDTGVVLETAFSF